MSLAIQGSRLVATRRLPPRPMPRKQQYLDSVETLVTNSVFQKVVTTDVLVEWLMVQNLSERPITLRLTTDGTDTESLTLGEGVVLSKADSSGQGGGIMVLPKVDINLWFWATTTAGDKMYVVRLN